MDPLSRFDFVRGVMTGLVKMKRNKEVEMFRQHLIRIE